MPDQEKSKEGLLQELEELRVENRRLVRTQVRLASTLNALRAQQKGLEAQNEELVHTQEDLEQSRQNYIYLFDFAPIPLLSLDRRGHIVNVNLAGSKLLGHDRWYLLDRPLMTFLEPSSLSDFSRHLARVFWGEYDSVEVIMQGRSGRKTPVYLESIFTLGREPTMMHCLVAVWDLSDYKEMENALRRSRAEFQTLAENAPDAIVRVDANLKCLYLNPALAEMSGLPAKDILGRTHREMGWRPELISKLDSFFQTVLETHLPQTTDFEVNSNKVERFFQGKAVPEFEAEGRLETVLCLIRDVTAEKSAERAVRSSEALYRRIVETSMEGIWLLDQTLTITFCNSQMAVMLGLEVKDLLGRSPKHLGLWGPGWDKVASQEKTVFECHVPRALGEDFWGLVSTNPLVDEAGLFQGALVMITDVTDRKRFEEEVTRYRRHLEDMVSRRTWELAAAKNMLENEIAERKRIEEELRQANERLNEEHEQRKDLSKKLIDMLEGDRFELATYLHDHIGQILTTLKMDLNKIDQKISSQDKESMRVFQRIGDKIDLALQAVKNAAKELMPSLLSRLGLVPSLRALFDDLRKSTDLEIYFFHEDVPKKFDSTKELAVYRTVQEALTNVIKYAKAQKVFVNLTRRGDTLCLSIEDDGVGFDSEEAHGKARDQGSMGLQLMRERVTQCRGEFSVDSRPGFGTYLWLEMPIP